MENLVGVGLRPVLRVAPVPFPRDRLETIPNALNLRGLLRLALLARVDAIRDEALCFVTSIARVFQCNVRVDAEREALLLAGKPVLESPPPAAIRRELKVEPAAIK